MKKQFPRGFTLIELLIVIAIIAILALIAIPNFIEAQTRSKVARVKADMRTVATAIEAYFVDSNTYPLTAMDNANTLLSHYQGYLSCTGGGPLWNKTKCLTTPIAYLTSFPIDPFVENSDMPDLQQGANAINWKDVRNFSYWYVNVKGAVEYVTQGQSQWGAWGGATGTATNPFMSPAPLCFNGPGGKVYESHWALQSPGPAKANKIPRLNAPTSTDDYRLFLNTNAIWNRSTSPIQGVGYMAVYDPTNGTVSIGNIWRTSAGSPE